MTIYFAGSTLASFQRGFVSTTEESSGMGWYDATYVDRCISVSDPTEKLPTPVFGPASGTVWLRFDAYVVSSISLIAAVLFKNGASDVFRVVQNRISTVGVMTFQYHNGTAWVDTGGSYSWPNAALVTVVIRIDLNSGFQMFVNGSLVASGSGWTGGQTQVNQIVLSCLGAAAYYSQIVVGDYDLRDTKYRLLNLTGNSAVNNGQASGTFSDVQELSLNDATAINIATAGNKAGQTKAALTVPSGYKIMALSQSARVRATAPRTDAKLGVRSGGTNYSSAGVGAGGVYGPANRIDNTDPATSADWTESGLNSAEIYQEAV